MFCAGNSFAVHFQRAQLVVVFGRERNGDRLSEADAFRHGNLAAGHLLAAVDLNCDGNIDIACTDLQFSVFQHRGMRRITVILLAEIDARDLFVKGEGIIAAAARKRKLHPCICVLLDIDGNAVILFSVRIDREHKVDAALLAHICHRGGIVCKTPFALLTFEHHVLIPFGKAESVLSPVFQPEIHGRRKCRQVVKFRSFKPEEPAEHKAAFERADVTLYFTITACSVSAAFQRELVQFKDDLRVCCGREEHIVGEFPVCEVIDRDVIQPRRKPRERERAVSVRRRRLYLVASREGNGGIGKRILRAFAVNGRNERLFARCERFEHRFHRNVARDLLFGDLNICLLHVTLRICTQRGVHIIMNVIARDSDAVDAEFL